MVVISEVDTALSTVQYAYHSQRPPNGGHTGGTLITGQLVTAEGMLISVDSASKFTPADVYDLIRQSARNLGVVGPSTVVRLQDTYASQCSASAVRVGDAYTNFKASIYYKGVNSTFSVKPESQAAHEYGHAYTLRAYYMVSKRLWTDYLKARGLYGDPRINTSYAWTPAELAADDYRLLFGSDKVLAQSPKHMNPYVAQPSTITGLAAWMAKWGGG